MAIPTPTSLSKDPSSSSYLTPFKASNQIFVSNVKFRGIEHTHLSLTRSGQGLKLKASNEPRSQEHGSGKLETNVGIEKECDLFDEMRHRFLSFKRHKFMKSLEHYQNLANCQAPKFMVIACADSRVCPSIILGFQPGDAFIVRNVANMVPPCESGPSETNAALEFAVNSLEVENILVIGHSRCGGIQALMSMQDESDSSFIRSWVIVGKNAKLKTKAAADNLNFDHQCRYCEKESVNCSLKNLLTYPWIEDRVSKGILSLHGGYYDFIDCTFEKWTLEHKGSENFIVKDCLFWC